MTISVGEAEKLLEIVKHGTSAQVELYLDSITTPHGRTILKEVQLLLRGLEQDRTEAMVNIEADLATSAAYRCQNALEQINYIADKTMSAAGDTLALCESLKEELVILEQDGSLNKSDSMRLIRVLTEIMLKQSYQDLTGQVVGKLASFIERIELSLSQFVDLGKAGGVEAELGPSISSSERALAVDGQDDIDAILMANSPKEV